MNAPQALQQAIHAEAAKAVGRADAWIDGKAYAAKASFASISPIDGRPLAEIANCTAPDIDIAVAAARKAFNDRRWVGLGRRERKRMLLRFADLILEHKLELGVLQSRDMGMPAGMAVNGDVGEAAATIRWYAEALDKLADELLPLSERETGYVSRVPLGVVGIIVPWNFPLMIAAWKLGPALAAGNSVVLKPAEDASLAIARLGELASEAGIPDGVLNIVTGTGDGAGKPLALHRDVDAIAFTGSGRTGGKLLEYAGQSNLKRVSLECGGKTANIVMEDAPDMEEAVQTAARAIFRNQGQICNAPSRLLVQSSIRESFTKRVIEIAKTLKIGTPLELTSDLGPVVSDRQKKSIASALENAERAGIAIELDGRKASLPSEGCYLGPTIATNVPATSDLAQQEVFGPVLAIISFDTLDEAISIANGTRYALGAAIWTRDIDKAAYATERLHAGSLYINACGGVIVEMPFGGFKESGYGRDRSLHAFDKYTDLKATLHRRSLAK